MAKCFEMPAKDAAAKLGICVTSLKKMMRRHGISRWPFRKMRCLNAAIGSTELVGFERMPEPKEQAAFSACSTAFGPAAEGPGAKYEQKSHEASTASEGANIESLAFSPSAAAAEHHHRDCVSLTTTASPQMGAALSASAAAPPICGVYIPPLADRGWTSGRRTGKAESAIERPAPEDNGLWPVFSISGISMHSLLVHHWSSLWTIQQLKKYILEPAQGTSVSISECGSKAYLCFPSQLAAVQAKELCETACRNLSQLQESRQCSQTVRNKVERWLPQPTAPPEASFTFVSSLPSNASGCSVSPFLSPQPIVLVSGEAESAYDSVSELSDRGDDDGSESASDHDGDAASADQCEAPVAIQGDPDEDDELDTDNLNLKQDTEEVKTPVQISCMKLRLEVTSLTGLARRQQQGDEGPSGVEMQQGLQVGTCPPSEPAESSWGTRGKTWDQWRGCRGSPVDQKNSATFHMSPASSRIDENSNDLAEMSGPVTSELFSTQWAISPFTSPGLTGAHTDAHVPDIAGDNMSISRKSLMSFGSDNGNRTAASVASRDSFVFSEFFELLPANACGSEAIELNAATALDSYLHGI